MTTTESARGLSRGGGMGGFGIDWYISLHMILIHPNRQRDISRPPSLLNLIFSNMDDQHEFIGEVVGHNIFSSG